MPKSSPRFQRQHLQATRRAGQPRFPLPNIWIVKGFAILQRDFSLREYILSFWHCGIRAYVFHPIPTSDVTHKNPTTIHFGIDKSNSAFALPLCIDSNDFFNNDKGCLFLWLLIQDKVLLIWLPD